MAEVISPGPTYRPSHRIHVDRPMIHPLGRPPGTIARPPFRNLALGQRVGGRHGLDHRHLDRLWRAADPVGHHLPAVGLGAACRREHRQEHCRHDEEETRQMHL